MKTLLGHCTQFQLEPMAYPALWDITRSMRDNTWTPEEIGVGPDIATFHRLQQSDDPQDKTKLHYFYGLWGQLTAFDMLRSEDATALMTMLFEPEEVKHFLIRLAWEERLHTESYRYVVQNFGIPETGPDSIYEMWMCIPSMKARMKFAEQSNKKVHNIVRLLWNKKGSADKLDISDKQALLEALIFWFLIFEGVWFMVNLSGPLQHMARAQPVGAKEFEGAAKQLYYIARDEQQHIRGGIELIKVFMREQPATLDKAFLAMIQEMWEKSLALEKDYAAYCASAGQLFGYTASDHIETCQFFANRMMRSVGLPEPFVGAKHCFPWMSEVMETRREQNFFEGTVTEYRAGTDLWKEHEPTGMPDSMFDHLNTGKK